MASKEFPLYFSEGEGGGEFEFTCVRHFFYFSRATPKLSHLKASKGFPLHFCEGVGGGVEFTCVTTFFFNFSRITLKSQVI